MRPHRMPRASTDAPHTTVHASHARQPVRIGNAVGIPGPSHRHDPRMAPRYGGAA